MPKASSRCILQVLSEVAPSLAVFLESVRDMLVSGKVPLPSAAAPPRAPRQKVDAPTRLLDVLLERKMVESVDGAREELCLALRESLAAKPESVAVERTLALFMNHEGVAEVFVDEEILAEIVREFV